MLVTLLSLSKCLQKPFLVDDQLCQFYGFLKVKTHSQARNNPHNLCVWNLWSCSNSFLNTVYISGDSSVKNGTLQCDLMSVLMQCKTMVYFDQLVKLDSGSSLKAWFTSANTVVLQSGAGQQANIKSGCLHPHIT